jgi:hypothetical protein
MIALQARRLLVQSGATAIVNVRDRNFRPVPAVSHPLRKKTCPVSPRRPVG